MFMTIQLSVKDKILATPTDTSKVENAPAEMLRDLDQQMEKRADDEKVIAIYVSKFRTGLRDEGCNAKNFWFSTTACDTWFRVRGMTLAAQSEAFKQENTLEDIMRACVIDFSGSYHSSIRCPSFKALYGRKCMSHVLWAEIGESSLTGLELVQEMTYKVVLVKEKLKAARDRQKSYVDYRCKSLEFEVGDHVLLKVTPSCKLRLPEELSSVHDTFHVSNLKKVLEDANLHVPLDEIEAEKTLHFVEETMGIMDREI
nr:putative reverse transcriptase domain-containing protein [Tanacetum cinerariifolium]